MALSDCPKCWDTPCTCGHEYRHVGPAYKLALITAILGVDPHPQYAGLEGALVRLMQEAQPEEPTP